MDRMDEGFEIALVCLAAAAAATTAVDVVGRKVQMRR